MIESDILVVRDGAALRTADELSRLFVSDAVDCGAELSPWGLDVLARFDRMSETSDYGTTWLPQTYEGETLRDELGSLVDQVEADLGTLGLAVDWEDGYVIRQANLADDED